MSELSIITWNLGFGGLGREANIRYEGGKRLIPSTYTTVRKNRDGILKTLREHDADVWLLQEITTGSILNYGCDILNPILGTLAAYDTSTYMQFSLPLPRPLSSEHGMTTAVKKTLAATFTSTRLIASEEYTRWIKRHDGIIASQVLLEGGRTLTLLNVHFAAFDEDGSVRHAQFNEVLAYAELKHKEGPVIIGGDFNLRLVPAIRNVQHRRPCFAFPLPAEKLPDKWKVLSDAYIPTARSNQLPWRRRFTETATIDGFIVSPEIQDIEVRALESKFIYSDHNPVMLRCSIRD